MADALTDGQVQDARRHYNRLWELILKRKIAQTSSRRVQADIAEQLKISEPVVSKIISGKGLPHAMSNLVAIAEYCSATEQEIRVLLILASALKAVRKQREVAAYLLKMFDPLYPKEAFGTQLLSYRQIVRDVLADLGASAELAASLTVSLPEKSNDLAGDLGRFVLSLPCSPPRGDLSKVRELMATYTTVAVGHFRERPAAALLRRAVKRGDCEAGVWSKIPNISVTRIKIKPGRAVYDREHEGYEFLFLHEGAGDFRLGKHTNIRLTQRGRNVLAYRPTEDHAFVADAAEPGATIYVLSYVRWECGGIKKFIDTIADSEQCAANEGE